MRIRVVAGLLCLSLRAAAQESALPSTDAVRPPEDVVHGAADDEAHATGGRTVGSVIAALLTRLAKVEVSEVQHLADRFAKVIDTTAEDTEFEVATKRAVELREFTRRLEDTQFEVATKRAVELQAFTRRLEAQHEETEAREFDERIGQFLRKSAFLQKLMREQSAARTDSRNGTGHDPARWDLYKRE